VAIPGARSSRGEPSTAGVRRPTHQPILEGKGGPFTPSLDKHFQANQPPAVGLHHAEAGPTIEIGATGADRQTRADKRQSTPDRARRTRTQPGTRMASVVVDDLPRWPKAALPSQLAGLPRRVSASLQRSPERGAGKGGVNGPAATTQGKN